jgi:hypothetical protein
MMAPVAHSLQEPFTRPSFEPNELSVQIPNVFSKIPFFITVPPTPIPCAVWMKVRHSLCKKFYGRIFLGKYVWISLTQAVSRWLPTTAARVRSQVKQCGICGGKSGAAVGFPRVLRFPLPILSSPTAPHSSSTIRCWYNRPISGRRAKWTWSHPTLRNVLKVRISHWLKIPEAGWWTGLNWLRWIETRTQ